MQTLVPLSTFTQFTRAQYFQYVWGRMQYLLSHMPALPPRAARQNAAMHCNALPINRLGLPGAMAPVANPVVYHYDHGANRTIPMRPLRASRMLPTAKLSHNGMVYTVAPCRGKAAKAYLNAPLPAFSAYAMLPQQVGPLTAHGWALVVFRAGRRVKAAGNCSPFSRCTTRAHAHSVVAYLISHGLLVNA